MKNFNNILNKSYQTLSSSPMSWNTICDSSVVRFNDVVIDPKQHLKNTREIRM
jgi:hypothetical protein